MVTYSQQGAAMDQKYRDNDFVFRVVGTPSMDEDKMFALTRKTCPSSWTDEKVWQNVRILQRENEETQCYLSPKFQVLRRELWDEQHGFGENVPTYLSIKRIDRKPLSDWRAKQRIKNAVLGDDWEAVEIYPMEKRLVDTSNQYHLFAWQALFPIYLFNNREVYSKEYAEDLNKEVGTKMKQQ